MIHFISPFFAGCSAPYDEARYVFFGVPFDSTTTYRAGTRSGPAAIRKISANFEEYLPAYDLDLSDVPMADLGDVDVPVVPRDAVFQVQEVVEGIVRDGKIPVMLGGEHTITPGAIRAIKPDCFVVCDAHLDLREEFRGERYNHACATRIVYDEGCTDIVIIGGRSGTRGQFGFAKRITLITANEVNRSGIDTVMERVKAHIGKKRVYLSIDADVIDCSITPGVGTPEPFGLSPQDMRKVIAAVAPSSAAFDYMEVLPIDQGQTAAVAVQLIREFIAAHWTATGR
jgi:agmatinase